MKYRFVLTIWMPYETLDITDQRTLQRCFYLNGVNGKFPFVSGGKHKVMGHCMVSIRPEGSEGPDPRQILFGKTSPDGPVEEAWAKAMRLDYGPFWMAYYALATNVLGAEPAYRTPLAPEQGVKYLFEVQETARYEIAGEFRASRRLSSVVWSVEIDEAGAEAGLDWINASGPGRDRPQDEWYGFGNAC
jgi:hypothetical protein